MVKEISLTQGQVALVDDEDYNYLNQWKWEARHSRSKSNYYAARKKYLGKINGKYRFVTVRMHRLLMNAPKNKQVDHINHNTLDNRKCNLRIVSPRQNMQNREVKSASRYPGVYWERSHNRWRARIVIDGKPKHLGYFKDECEAAKAYERACRSLGEELVCKMESK